MDNANRIDFNPDALLCPYSCRREVEVKTSRGNREAHCPQCMRSVGLETLAFAAYARGYRAGQSKREPGCKCHWEAGDSPCTVHGEDESATAGAEAQ